MRYLILILSFFYSGLAITQTSTVYYCQPEVGTGLVIENGEYTDVLLVNLENGRYSFRFENNFTRLNISSSGQNIFFDDCELNTPYVICKDNNWIFNLDTNEYLESQFNYRFLRITRDSSIPLFPSLQKGTCSAF